MHFNRLNHAVKESTPNARGLVLSNVTRFHGTLFRVLCLVFGKILIMSNRNNYHIIADNIAHPAPLSFWLIFAKPFVKLIKLHFNHRCKYLPYVTSTCLRRVDVEIL